MNLHEVLFFIGLILMVGLTLSKIYNLLMVGKWYDFKISIILFVVNVLLWYFMMVSFLRNFGDTLLLDIFTMNNYLFVFNTVFFLAEVLMYSWAAIGQKLEEMGLMRRRGVPTTQSEKR